MKKFWNDTEGIVNVLYATDFYIFTLYFTTTLKMKERKSSFINIT